jgi:hypothetical protein
MATSYEADITAALIAQVVNNLASIDATWVSTANIAYPGVHLPIGSVPSFVALDLVFDHVKQAWLGPNADYYVEGTWVMAFFGEQGSGSAGLAQHRDAARALFAQGSQLGFGTNGRVLVFRPPVPEGPRENDNELLEGILRCPFYTYTP